MKETPRSNSNVFLSQLTPEDRERALFALDRYFDIVLRIFLRLEREGGIDGGGVPSASGQIVASKDPQRIAAESDTSPEPLSRRNG